MPITTQMRHWQLRKAPCFSPGVGNPRVKNNGNRIVNKLVEVTLGDSINIVCAAQGYPAPQITVVRGTQPLQGSTVTRNSVTYADAGSYSCKAATGNIVKITNFQVVVNGGCVVSLQKVVSSSMEDEDGAYVNLKCTATGHPACSMSMEPYGEYQPSSPGDNQLEMTIPDMKKQVSPVNFTCQASNNLGSHSATVILTDEAVCCVEPHKGGIGTGVVIIIILLVAVVLVGVPLAVYCYKKKESEKARSAKEEKELEADEGVKMNPGDENQA
uniref:Ig-like domain-containing protein n=1 Tax=Ciona savignyi TaxID=51511 RepID=H2YDH8_CIOSA